MGRHAGSVSSVCLPACVWYSRTWLKKKSLIAYYSLVAGGLTVMKRCCCWVGVELDIRGEWVMSCQVTEDRETVWMGFEKVSLAFWEALPFA